MACAGAVLRALLVIYNVGFEADLGFVCGTVIEMGIQCSRDEQHNRSPIEGRLPRSNMILFSGSH